LPLISNAILRLSHRDNGFVFEWFLSKIEKKLLSILYLVTSCSSLLYFCAYFGFFSLTFSLSPTLPPPFSYPSKKNFLHQNGASNKNNNDKWINGTHKFIYATCECNYDAFVCLSVCVCVLGGGRRRLCVVYLCDMWRSVDLHDLRGRSTRAIKYIN